MVGNVAGEEEQVLPLRFVVSIICSELQGLCKNIDQIQVALSPVLSTIKLDEKSHTDIQSLDIISQKLSSLSCYLFELNRELPKNFRVNTQNALSVVSISSLKQCLNGNSSTVLYENSSGDLEIF